MTKKELAKHEWILETQMFQRIAHGTEEAYDLLSEEYDKIFKNASLRKRETLVENAKIQVTILKMADQSGVIK